jgi:hypothetical protein
MAYIIQLQSSMRRISKTGRAKEAVQILLDTEVDELLKLWQIFQAVYKGSRHFLQVYCGADPNS